MINDKLSLQSLRFLSCIFICEEVAESNKISSYLLSKFIVLMMLIDVNFVVNFNELFLLFFDIFKSGESIGDKTKEFLS